MEDPKNKTESISSQLEANNSYYNQPSTTKDIAEESLEGPSPKEGSNSSLSINESNIEARIAKAELIYQRADSSSFDENADEGSEMAEPGVPEQMLRGDLLNLHQLQTLDFADSDKNSFMKTKDSVYKLNLETESALSKTKSNTKENTQDNMNVENLLQSLAKNDKERKASSANSSEDNNYNSTDNLNETQNKQSVFSDSRPLQESASESGEHWLRSSGKDPNSLKTSNLTENQYSDITLTHKNLGYYPSQDLIIEERTEEDDLSTQFKVDSSIDFYIQGNPAMKANFGTMNITSQSVDFRQKQVNWGTTDQLNKTQLERPLTKTKLSAFGSPEFGVDEEKEKLSDGPGKMDLVDLGNTGKSEVTVSNDVFRSTLQSKSNFKLTLKENLFSEVFEKSEDENVEDIKKEGDRSLTKSLAPIKSSQIYQALSKEKLIESQKINKSQESLNTQNQNLEKIVRRSIQKSKENIEKHLQIIESEENEQKEESGSSRKNSEKNKSMQELLLSKKNEQPGSYLNTRKLVPLSNKKEENLLESKPFLQVSKQISDDEAMQTEMEDIKDEKVKTKQPNIVESEEMMGSYLDNLSSKDVKISSIIEYKNTQTSDVKNEENSPKKLEKQAEKISKKADSVWKEKVTIANGNKEKKFDLEIIEEENEGKIKMSIHNHFAESNFEEYLSPGKFEKDNKSNESNSEENQSDSKKDTINILDTFSENMIENAEEETEKSTKMIQGKICQSKFVSVGNQSEKKETIEPSKQLDALMQMVFDQKKPEQDEKEMSAKGEWSKFLKEYETNQISQPIKKEGSRTKTDIFSVNRIEESMGRDLMMSRDVEVPVEEFQFPVTKLDKDFSSFGITENKIEEIPEEEAEAKFYETDNDARELTSTTNPLEKDERYFYSQNVPKGVKNEVKMKSMKINRNFVESQKSHEDVLSRIEREFPSSSEEDSPKPKKIGKEARIDDFFLMKENMEEADDKAQEFQSSDGDEKDLKSRISKRLDKILGADLEIDQDEGINKEPVFESTRKMSSDSDSIKEPGDVVSEEKVDLTKGIFTKPIEEEESFLENSEFQSQSEKHDIGRGSLENTKKSKKINDQSEDEKQFKKIQKSERQIQLEEKNQKLKNKKRKIEIEIHKLKQSLNAINFKCFQMQLKNSKFLDFYETKDSLESISLENEIKNLEKTQLERKSKPFQQISHSRHNIHKQEISEQVIEHKKREREKNDQVEQDKKIKLNISLNTNNESNLKIPINSKEKTIPSVSELDRINRETELNFANPYAKEIRTSHIEKETTIDKLHNLESEQIAKKVNPEVTESMFNPNQSLVQYQKRIREEMKEEAEYQNYKNYLRNNMDFNERANGIETTEQSEDSVREEKKVAKIDKKMALKLRMKKFFNLPDNFKSKRSSKEHGHIKKEKEDTGFNGIKPRHQKYKLDRGLDFNNNRETKYSMRRETKYTKPISQYEKLLFRQPDLIRQPKKE